MSSDVDQIVARVQAALSEPLPDTAPLRRALTCLDAGLGALGWRMDGTQRFALGTHLASVVRRFATGDRLPDIEDEILTQVSQPANELADEILGTLQPPGVIQPEERFLIAVHLDTAQLS